ncbi:MAG: tyrosine-type recombinase/integrase, partial [Desulfobulbaceae bacterium]|nr:tyrosine-type recombinase/integrase [Desulfobulbaceae bacterium]
PGIFEDYLHYCAAARYDTEKTVQHTRRVLEAFHHYLKRHDINLSAITIEQIDAFEREYNAAYAQQSQKINRGCLKIFLKYLYHERRELNRDIAALLKVPRIFHRTKPPCFLRTDEIQQLFDNMTLLTPADLRTYAMVHIAYTMGLRPQEICKLTLDDIQFSKAEMHIRDRKASSPITLPIPPKTLKAIAAYLVGGRPENKYRELFLQCNRPHGPINPPNVYYRRSQILVRAGICYSVPCQWLPVELSS